MAIEYFVFGAAGVFPLAQRGLVFRVRTQPDKVWFSTRNALVRRVLLFRFRNPGDLHPNLAATAFAGVRLFPCASEPSKATGTFRSIRIGRFGVLFLIFVRHLFRR